jgi:hypothetical protein
MHQGQAMPTAPSARVFVSGQPVTTLAGPYTVAGCAFVPPAGNGPCVTAQWTVGSTSVLVEGQPVLLNTGQAVCTPTGTGLLPVEFQVRVTAQ